MSTYPPGPAQRAILDRAGLARSGGRWIVVTHERERIAARKLNGKGLLERHPALADRWRLPRRPDEARP